MASTVAGAAPTGLYRSAGLGLLELVNDGGHLSGRYKGNGACRFKNEVQLLKGALEGNIFVGTVMLCQEGPSCETEKVFPILGVWRDQVLVSEVKLDAACSSPALDGNRLVLSAASADDKPAVHAQNKKALVEEAQNKKALREEAQRLYELGRQKLIEGDFRNAAQLFERAVGYDDSHWDAWQGLGVCALHLKNVEKSLASFQKALAVASTAKVTEAQLGDLHFNLACAYAQSGAKKDALASLRTAIKVGGAAGYLEQLDRESDLDPIRGDQEFRLVLAEARVAKEKGPRKR